MPRPFYKLDGAAFRKSLRNHDWKRRVWRVDMHHTWYPTQADYCGNETIEKMYRFHVEERGWDDIAQHISIAPDGALWTGRDWNATPASVGGGLNKGVFMFETIGNFDDGFEVLEGAQLESVILVIAEVQKFFGLPAEALLFHREVPLTDKTCPGTSIDKGHILDLVRSYREKSADFVA